MRCTAPMFGMLALAAVTGSASAASSSGMTATPVAPGETLQGTAAPLSPAQPLPADPQVRSITTEAMADLAGRLSIPVERIDFVEFRPVLWPNRGLGCPRPGMIYPQVQEDGYLIRLRAGKREFHYHGSGSRPPFLCEAGG